ncbi:MAG TPA: DUF6452 family protein [Flavipsychrobacter sp.]|nr:DUF6452 family protein [Flavipsychrobacter sp.]
MIRNSCLFVFSLLRFFTQKFWLPTTYCVLLTAYCLSSCEQQRDPCLQPTTAYLRLRSMKNVADTTVADSLLPNPRWSAIDSGVTLIFGRRTGSFSLSLNASADSSRYAIQPDSAVFSFDTLTFFYDRRLQFLSNACGYTYFYNLRSIKTTNHNVDSVLLRNNEVNGNVNTPDHVQVFF